MTLVIVNPQELAYFPHGLCWATAGHGIRVRADTKMVAKVLKGSVLKQYWLVVTGCHFWLIFPLILGIIIIPHFSEGFKPATRIGRPLTNFDNSLKTRVPRPELQPRWKAGWSKIMLISLREIWSVAPSGQETSSTFPSTYDLCHNKNYGILWFFLSN